MSGTTVMWGQADRGQGFGVAHLFWRDAEVPALDAGHVAVCGYDPVHHNGRVADSVAFRAAPDDALRCARCMPRAEALIGHTYYPLGEHPADLARDGR